MRILATLGLAALAATVVLMVAAPALAGGDKEVTRNGSCSGSTDWKLELERDDGRIETEFEVDQNRNGERWRVTLKRDGNRFFRAASGRHTPPAARSRSTGAPGTTRGPTGSRPARSTWAAARSAAAQRPSSVNARSGRPWGPPAPCESLRASAGRPHFGRSSV